MEQIHKRFTAEQVKVLLKGYCQGALDRLAIEETLGISKTRFFALLTQYRRDPDNFSITYRRTTSARLPPDIRMDALEVRIWWDNRMVQSLTYPLREFPRVHF